jgi:hypothetical protein
VTRSSEERPPSSLCLTILARRTLRRKLSNVYLTDAPIELVCYTGRTAVPDDFSLNTLRDTTDNQGTHPFRRIWFLGEETCEVV